LRSDFGRVSRKGPGFKGVMAGLVPAIHVFRAAYPIRQQQGAKGFVPVRSVADMRDRPSGGAAWMAGTSPATTAGYRRAAKKAATASLVFRSRRHKQLQPVINAVPPLCRRGKRPVIHLGAASCVVVGDVLPTEGVILHPVPREYGVTDYQYTVVDDTPVLVDPATRRIVEVVP
jgi:hypothetical protein